MADASTSLMALLYGAFLGALSSLLVVALLVRVVPSTTGEALVRSTVGLVSWIASWWLVSVRAREISAVFQRALLLGAVEWLALTTWGRVEASAMARTGDPARTGVESDALTGGVAMTMLWVCLIGWAVCRWARTPNATEVGGLDGGGPGPDPGDVPAEVSVESDPQAPSGLPGGPQAGGQK